MQYKSGWESITPAEKEVLSCWMTGKTAKRVAQILSKQPRTVDAQVQNIMQKLCVHNRNQLIETVEENKEIVKELRQIYKSLLKKYEFDQFLTGLAFLLKAQDVSVHFMSEILDTEKRFITDLKKIGVQIVEKERANKVVVVSENKQNSEENMKNIFWSGDYYTTFLEIACHLFIDVQIKEKYAHFMNKLEKSNENISEERKIYIDNSEKNIVKLKKLTILLFLFFTALIVVLIYDKYSNITPVRCEVLLPREKNTLSRDLLMKKIDDKFADQKESIKLLVLSGLGGAGKTTIAKLYAQRCKNYTFWFINAETRGRKKINDLGNPWLLTFDNVEKTQEIYDFRPKDCVTC